MDPDECLRLCRQAVLEYQKHNANLNPSGCFEAMADLWCHFQDLDEWLTKGGFLPKTWERNPK